MFPGAGSYDSQRRFDFTVEKSGQNNPGSKGQRTIIQIECPDIIKIRLWGHAAEDEDLGTDQRHGVVVATAGPGTIDHYAGPLTGYWNARKF